MNRLSEDNERIPSQQGSREAREIWLESVARMGQNDKIKSRLDKLERSLATGTHWQAKGRV